MGLADPVSKFSCEGDRFFFRLWVSSLQINGHIDAGDVPLRRDEPANEQRLGKGDLADFLECGRRQILRFRHQVGDDQVVPFGPRVLIVRQRIDARRIRRLPRFFRQFSNRRQCFRCENVAVLRRDHEKNIVVAAIDVL